MAKTLILYKHTEIETSEPGKTVRIRATPNDASDNDRANNFYIADIIRRNIDGLATYSIETRTFSPAELKAELGIDPKQRIKCI